MDIRIRHSSLIFKYFTTRRPRPLSGFTMPLKLPQLTCPLPCGIIIGIGGALMGLSIGYMSPTIVQIAEKFDFTDMEVTMFNVSAQLCAILGSFIFNGMLPKIGFRYAVMLVDVVSFGSFFGIGLANSKWLIFLMRCINGLSLGGTAAVCPVYLQVITPPERASMYGFFNQIGCSVGFLLIALFGLAKDYLSVSCCCAAVGMLQCVLIPFVPLSRPGVDNAENKEEGENKEEEKKDEGADDQEEKPKESLFKSWKALLVSIGLMFFLQFSGINAMLSNLESIIIDSNISMDAGQVSLGVTAAQLVATVGTSFVVDKFSPKACWIVSAAGQTIAFILIGIQQFMDLHGYFFIFTLVLDQISWSVGTGPVPYSLAPQLFPGPVIGQGMSVASSCSWIFSAIMIFVWPELTNAFKLGGAFLFLGAICALSVVFGWFFVHVPPKGDDHASNCDDIDEEKKEPSGDMADAATAT